MNNDARMSCLMAMEHIRAGQHAAAQNYLRAALKGTCHPRAKSKLMLAIRECNRAMRATS